MSKSESTDPPGLLTTPAEGDSELVSLLRSRLKQAVDGWRDAERDRDKMQERLKRLARELVSEL